MGHFGVPCFSTTGLRSAENNYWDHFYPGLIISERKQYFNLIQ